MSGTNTAAPPAPIITALHAIINERPLLPRPGAGEHAQGKQARESTREGVGGNLEMDLMD